MTDGGHARVRELGSICRPPIFVFFIITLSNVVRLLQNFVQILFRLGCLWHYV